MWTSYEQDAVQSQLSVHLVHPCKSVPISQFCSSNQVGRAIMSELHMPKSSSQKDDILSRSSIWNITELRKLSRSNSLLDIHHTQVQSENKGFALLNLVCSFTRNLKKIALPPTKPALEKLSGLNSKNVESHDFKAVSHHHTSEQGTFRDWIESMARSKKKI